MCRRDAPGHASLWYARRDDASHFTTSLTFLLRLEAVRRKPDPLRVAQFLCEDFPVGARSFYRGIGQVPPGHRRTR